MGDPAAPAEPVPAESHGTPDTLVALLRCPACGAPVPLGPEDGPLDKAGCAACGLEVALDARYLAFREARRQSALDLARARALAERLVAPPGPLLRAAVSLAGVLLFLASLYFLAWYGVCAWHYLPELLRHPLDAGTAAAGAALFGFHLAWDALLHGASSVSGVDWMDALSPLGAYALLGVVFSGHVLLPLSVLEFRDGFEGARAAVAKALAAKPPSTAGGASTCRACGAPLSVAQDGLLARCQYCLSDNLLNLPRALVERATQGGAAQQADLQAATDAVQRAWRTGIAGLRGTLHDSLVAVAVCVLMGWFNAYVFDEGWSFWYRVSASAPMRPLYGGGPPLVEGVRTPFPVRKTWDTCKEGTCRKHYLVPLARGERPRFDTEGPLEVEGLSRLEVARPWAPDHAWVPLADGAAAPYAGWFLVTFSIPQATGEAPRSILWARTR